jgi:hypothetical protein
VCQTHTRFPWAFKTLSNLDGLPALFVEMILLVELVKIRIMTSVAGLFIEEIVRKIIAENKMKKNAEAPEDPA